MYVNHFKGILNILSYVRYVNTFLSNISSVYGGLGNIYIHISVIDIRLVCIFKMQIIRQYHC